MQTDFGTTSDERNWGMYAHLSGMLAYSSMPFGGVLGPLIIYLTIKNRSPYMAEQARSALNFHLTWSILYFFLLISTVVEFFGWSLTWPAHMHTFPAIPIGLIAVGVACVACYVWTFVLTLIGTIISSQGTIYRYPLTIPFVRHS